ncbi:hypothetical protein G5S34_17305 [Herbaspirillum frisingense]|uniref:phage tail assembly chaperone n=1 Tax=Herbaspirillum frisingense TaxID=92645 RepID=UPI001604722D|nr:hypothetical protein [Herbaspirillum frisingense]QNB08337.1 hypothetical protein G5S34_17305 [Herbaspirillum frisingense]
MGIELELAGKGYSIGKMSAKKQFHVSRRIAPLIPKLIPLFTRVRKGGGISSDLDGLAEVLQPFADALAKMNDEDAEYVMDACMAVIQRKNDFGWTAAWNEQVKQPMFDDIDLGVMLPLTVRCIVVNLGPFIQGLLTSPGGSPETLAG